MLKIAEYNKKTGEKIELKDLEKYGFTRSKYYEEIYFKETENDKICRTALLVNPINKKIERQIVHFIEADNLNEDDIIDLTCELDAIYDLIEAGIIEKVEEEK